jgi:LEA14-like dessication related protein
MFYKIRFFLIQVLFVSLLTACASVPSDFEEPAVSVTSFKPINSGGITPQFEIVLHVTNPNRDPLELEGMSYTIYLEGNKVMSGVSNDLPTIEPYGEADVTLNATADLFGGFKLFSGLMSSPKDNIDYEFKAKLDIGTFMPLIHVVKKGTL